MARLINIKFFILIPVILSTVINVSTAQIKSNLEVFDEQISKEIERVLFKPDIRRDIQFIFSVNSLKNSGEETKFLNSIIKRTAERNKIWASLTKENIESGDSLYNSVYMEIVEMKTIYPGFAQNHFLGSKIVHRNLVSLIHMTIKGNNYNLAEYDSITVNYKDRVELDNIENLESADYKFTKATPPKVSFYEEIVFPVAVIVISVAAAVLFFAIRSK